MGAFDSPILLCRIRKRVVLRDTTFESCAHAHHCQLSECPFADQFLYQYHEVAKKKIVIRPGAERKQV